MLLYPPLDNQHREPDGGDASPELLSEAGVETSAVGARCASNAECSQRHHDEPYRCEPMTGSCQALLTDDCTMVLGDWQAKNAFWLGAYAAMAHGPAPQSDVIRNYQLAINELNAEGGLPDRAGTRHPLAAVVCNNDPGLEARETSLYDVTLRHLVSELGVPAVIADVPPAALIDAYHATHKDGTSVLLLSPGPANDALLALDDDGLVWSLIGSPRELRAAYRSLVLRIEAYVKTHIASRPAGDLRVAVVHSADPSEPNHELLGELNDAVLPYLQFNGRPWADNPLNTAEFVVGTALDSARLVAADVLAFRPDVVISMASGSFSDMPADGLRAGVAYEMVLNAEDQRETPFYVLSPANAGPAFIPLSKFVSDSDFGSHYPALPHRVLGINVAAADDFEVYQEYRKRLGVAFGLGKTNDAFENYYDAIYYLAYAAYAVGLQPGLDGLQLKTGLVRLTSGPRFDVGPDSTTAVLAALRSPNDSILLAGAGGTYFDVSHGVRSNKAALFCVVNGPDVRERSQIYSTASETWTPATTECTPDL